MFNRYYIFTSFMNSASNCNFDRLGLAKYDKFILFIIVIPCYQRIFSPSVKVHAPRLLGLSLLILPTYFCDWVAQSCTAYGAYHPSADRIVTK